jgi:hypothetical protein
LAHAGKARKYIQNIPETQMEVSRIIAEIDSQIAKLQQARALLSGTTTTGRGPGRPKGSVSAKPRRKHKLSAEGRRRISESQKRRWAERRKAASKGSK